MGKRESLTTIGRKQELPLRKFFCAKMRRKGSRIGKNSGTKLKKSKKQRTRDWLAKSRWQSRGNYRLKRWKIWLPDMQKCWRKRECALMLRYTLRLGTHMLILCVRLGRSKRMEHGIRKKKRSMHLTNSGTRFRSLTRRPGNRKSGQEGGGSGREWQLRQTIWTRKRMSKNGEKCGRSTVMPILSRNSRSITGATNGKEKKTWSRPSTRAMQHAKWKKEGSWLSAAR